MTKTTQPAAAASVRGFAPDAARAAALDKAVRAGLADSIHTICAAFDPPRAANDPKLAGLLRRIRSGPVAPALFGAYVEFVLAIFDERMDEAQRTLAELLRPRQPAVAPFTVCTLDEPALGEGAPERYRRLLAADIACPIVPLSPGELAAAKARLDAALELMRAGAPDVFGEFRALVREVVMVRPDARPGQRTFGAASTFSLWGALVMNAEAMPDRLSVAMQLAHEAAHAHLFGAASGGRITENDPAERYPSPLRRDPRPMEGVAHAAFVTGRTIYLLDRLLESGALRAAEAADARGRLADLETLEADGRETVRRHARLAAAGADVFAGLDAFMAARRVLARP